MGGQQFVIVGLVVLSLLMAASAANQDTSFAFSPSLQNFTTSKILCTTNAGLTDPDSKRVAMCLTPPGDTVLGLNQSAVGRCMYNRSIQFSGGSSFSTAFSFNYLTDRQIHGEGFVFIISTDGSYAPQPLSEGREFMGWLNSSTNGNSTGLNFGVEFDLKHTPAFQDPENAHVGINLDSMISLNTTETPIINTTNSMAITYAWIDYNYTTLEVEVRVSLDPWKPCQAMLSHKVDLSKLLSEPRYVGFAASTGPASSSLSQPTIFDWTFSSKAQPVDLWTASVNGQSFCDGSQAGNHSFWKKWYYVLLITGLPSLFVVCLVLWILRRRAQTPRISFQDITGSNHMSNSEAPGVEFNTEIYGPRIFSYEHLSVATNNFSKKNIIGKGGFGVVYKGTFPNHEAGGSSRSDDSTIAVKSIKEDNVDSKKEFQAEVETIGAVRHANLVRLRGWCCERGKYLIVYEYMPNGDLHELLHKKERAPGLPPRKAQWPVQWHVRMNIVKGLAAALTLLHEGISGKRMVHRDVKSRNVLLDGDYNARLGDFGLARFYPLDESALRTNRVAGTPDYMAPESMMSGRFTDKSDVYSFGVLMMEVATGQSPSFCYGGLPLWVATLYHEGKLLEAADPNLDLPQCGGYPAEGMTTMLTVALACCHFDPVRRPSMRHVQSYLDCLVPLDTLHPLPPLPQYGEIDITASTCPATADGPSS